MLFIVKYEKIDVNRSIFKQKGDQYMMIQKILSLFRWQNVKLKWLLLQLGHIEVDEGLPI